MNHLTPDELVDAVDDTLAPARQIHLTSCAQCRGQASQLAAVLSEARAVDVPEPSPLFWDRFSDRVRTAIADEPAVPARTTRWFEWPVLVPVGALGILVAALTAVVPHGTGGVTRAQLAIASSSQAPIAAFDSEAHWALVSEFVGDLDVDSARDAGIGTSPGTADGAVLQLTSSEQQELVRLLRQELQRPGG